MTRRTRLHKARQITANVVSDFRRYRRASQHSSGEPQGEGLCIAISIVRQGVSLAATSGFRIDASQFNSPRPIQTGWQERSVQGH